VAEVDTREASRQAAFWPYSPQPRPVHVAIQVLGARKRTFLGRSSAGIQDGDARLVRTRRHSTWLTPSKVREYLQSRGEMRAEPMDGLLASSSGHVSGDPAPTRPTR
jgi:hypothetical protein